MELIDINSEDKIIYQHNAITSGRYDYSACMLDILFMVLSTLEKDKLIYTIHTEDIEHITGRKWNIAQFTKSTEAMLTKMFEIEDETAYTQFVLFQYFKYLKGTRSIEVKLSEVSLPYFFELKNNFTAMQLKSVLNCSSKYAKRLYGLACQWRSVGKKRFEISELKKMLGLINKKGEEQFERVSEFKKKVLDVAKEQINKNTDIQFDYELTKRGRSFHWVTIFVNTQKSKVLEIDFGKSVAVQKFESKLKAYGFNEEQAEIIAMKEKEEDFDSLISDLKDRVRNRKLNVESPIAYLIGVYQNKGILPLKNKD
jgi:plasmid replication initiation protein